MSQLATYLQATNTILYCQQWAATVQFYGHQLGLPVNHQTDWFVEFSLSPTSFISVADAARASITAVGGQGITLTFKVSHLSHLHQLLQAQGVAVGPIQVKWGADLFYCHDPEGHRLEFWMPKTSVIG